MNDGMSKIMIWFNCDNYSTTKINLIFSLYVHYQIKNEDMYYTVWSVDDGAAGDLLDTQGEPDSRAQIPEIFSKKY